MKEHADKLGDSDREALNSAIEKVKEVAKGDDAAAINGAIEELDQVSQAFGSIY